MTVDDEDVISVMKRLANRRMAIWQLSRAKAAALVSQR
ncbi:hypothetical protein ACVWZL_009189 [Bradyrhizobium sp. GM2.4]